MKKKIWIVLALVVVALILLVNQKLPMIKVATGYSAKCLCSNTFLTDRSQKDVEAIDLAFLPVQAQNKIDTVEKSVTSSLFGFLGKQKAVFKDDLGCMLVHGKDDYNINYTDKQNPTPSTSNFPFGSTKIEQKPSGVNWEQLNETVANAFDENGELTDKQTRALLVLYKDSLIVEKYAKGHDENTRIIGWSMTKSMMNTLVGFLVKDGKLQLTDRNLFENWESDQRTNIQLQQLMNMNSGLAWEEDYTKVSDATKMLYLSEDVVNYASQPELQDPAGTTWYYSSGTTNLISGIIRRQFANTEEYYNFLHHRLFNTIGMNSAVVETDEAGNFIGSSYCYATARDWAKFGTLYLHDGVWNGERLLPEGWVEFTRTPARGSKGEYGAQWWLNTDQQYFPNSPADLFYASGFQGQKVVVIPSKQLVIVRLGFNSEFDFDALFAGIADAVASPNQ